MTRKAFFSAVSKVFGVVALSGAGCAAAEGASLARVRLWWEPIYVRHWGGSTTSQNRQDFAVDELRQKLGPVMRQFFLSHSACSHCDWPWPLTDGSHSVPLVPASEVDAQGFYLGRGCFAVCNRCWKWLRSVEGGDARLFALHQENRRRYWSDLSEDDLNVAINAEFTRENTRGLRMMSPKPEGFRAW